MANIPAVNFYADNFMGGTMFFTDAQVGKYMRALCAQCQVGHMSENQLNSIVKNDPEVLKKFVVDDFGLFFNIRMDKEIKKRLSYSENQRQRAVKRNYQNHATDMPGHSHGNAIIKTAIETETETETETPPKNLEKRKGDFVADVEKYTEYDLAMRSEFVTYWTEPNRSGKKMRFELERTWLLSGRLATWEKKAEQFSSRKRYGRQEVSMQELRDQAARIKLS